MTLPALLFGFLFATLIGAAFHLWKDGGFGRLILYLVLAWIGFWAGHLLAVSLGWHFLSVGPLRFGMAVLGALLFLGTGHWLSLVKDESE
ncbi:MULTISPECIES: hypothetical protein [Anaerolinea]|uniref:hypothetical protein n=1 Tax=Anaerolinea TaxID=233189 RepID=UPI002635044B|nr:hypothetical protein [Anaerolinea thermophila]